MATVIAFTGEKHHGKDTAASALDCPKLAFARPIKAMMRAFYQSCYLSNEEIEEKLEGPLKEKPCRFLGGRSPRYAMQMLGTEWGRNLIHPDIWTNIVKEAAETFLDAEENVAITDLRFHNEAVMVRQLGGIIIKIERPIDRNEHSHHVSETGIADLAVDAVIKNSGTIDDLRSAVSITLSSLL